MTNSNSNLALARQGNPKAIEAIINQQLHARGIRAKVNVKSASLYILLESEKVPPKSAALSFIQKGIISLSPSGIEKVYVYGKEIGLDAPDWGDSFPLLEQNQPKANIVNRTTHQSSDGHITTSFNSFEVTSTENNSNRGQSLDLKGKLQEIEQLRIEGAITAEEYTALRNNTLGVKSQPSNSGISNNSNAHTVVNVVTSQSEEKAIEKGGCYKQWLLHIILSIFTGGAWLIVWLILAIAKI